VSQSDDFQILRMSHFNGEEGGSRRGGGREGSVRVGKTILSVEAWVIMSNTKEKAEEFQVYRFRIKRHKTL
jgi:hypothetical protein